MHKVTKHHLDFSVNKSVEALAEEIQAHMVMYGCCVNGVCYSNDGDCDPGGGGGCSSDCPPSEPNEPTPC